MPYERYYQRFAHVLHLGRKRDFLMLKLQLAIILIKNQLIKLVIVYAIAKP